MTIRTEYEWTCGHSAGSMCQECYRILARKAHELAEENLELRSEVERLRRERPAVPGEPSKG